MIKPNAHHGWQLLVISLPGSRATPRMRVWRALKALGAAVLRDGVYLLPDSQSAQAAFTQQALEVDRAGGTAQVLRVVSPTPEQDRQFHALFDRASEYAHLLQKARKLKSDFSPRRYANAVRELKQLRREFVSINATDYFPGPAAAQARELLDEVEMAFTVPGEPSMLAGQIQRLNRKEYCGRTWATRARPWADRLASAWLIRRFIDSKARIVWLKDPNRCPRDALGFDFDGATFTHVGARVTFENLLASFSLEDDKALLHLGTLVHYLDVGGVPVAEAAGVESILRGMREHFADDDRLLAEASRIFDHFYISCQKE